MVTHTLEVVDLKDDQGRITCKVDRYDAALDPNKPLVVAWNATKCPRGFRSVGGGVAFVEKSDDWVHRRTPNAEPDHLGDGEFGWRDTSHHGKMMLIVILPTGYSFDDHQPVLTFAPSPSYGLMPTSFKAFNGRMAFYWELVESDESVRWKTAKNDPSELTSHVADLNRRAISHGRANGIVAQMDAGPNAEKKDGLTPGDKVQSENEDKPQPEPKGATGWLLEAARQVPALRYAIGVVGLVAAAALSTGLVFGHWEFALFGGIAVFVGMVLVRLYAASQPEEVRFNPSKPIQVVVWACVIAFVVLLGMGVLKAGFTLFIPTDPKPADDQRNNDGSKQKEQPLAKGDKINNAQATVSIETLFAKRLNDLALLDGTKVYIGLYIGGPLSDYNIPQFDHLISAAKTRDVRLVAVFPYKYKDSIMKSLPSNRQIALCSGLDFFNRRDVELVFFLGFQNTSGVIPNPLGTGDKEVSAKEYLDFFSYKAAMEGRNSYVFWGKDLWDPSKSVRIVTVRTGKTIWHGNPTADDVGAFFDKCFRQSPSGPIGPHK